MTRPSNWSTPSRPISSGGLLEKLGTGEACPHGNRVEGDTPQDRRDRGLRPLDEAPAESDSVVVSVFERDRRLLEYLHGLGIHPGAVVRMLASNYDDTLTLRIAGQPVQLGKSAAAKVWIAVSPVRNGPEPVKAGAGSSR